MATALLDRPTTDERVAGELVVSTPTRPVLAVLCSDQPQPDGLALDPRGADLTRYRRNPVLVVAHNMQKLPVGRVEDIRVSDIYIDAAGEIHVGDLHTDRKITGLVGSLVFDSTRDAREAEASVRGGFTRSVSVGFDVRKGDRDYRTGRVNRWSLREVSLVAVPMDEYARVYQRSWRPSYSYGPTMVDPRAARRLLDALTWRYR